MKQGGVFDGLLVLDFATTVTGPGAARVLADYGAMVIKVESMNHVESLRLNPPFGGGKRGVNRSGFFANYNAGKYGLALNLTTPKGIDLAKRLIRQADVIIESNRVGMMKKWGLSYEDLCKIKPDIIMVSTTQLGQYGPYATFRGYGTQGAGTAGWGSLIGWPDRAPTSAFGAYTDAISIRYVAIAIVSALEYRRRTGKGTYIDHAQVECSLQFQMPLFLDYSCNGRLQSLNGNRDANAAPHGAYRCKGEDRWCVIAVFDEHQWQSFCRIIGAPVWTQDPKFTSLSGRKEHEDELDKLVEEWTIQHTPEEVVQLMQSGDIGSAVVENAKDLFSDPQLQYRFHFSAQKHTEIGLHSYENFGFRLSSTPGGAAGPAPCLGEHTEYVCKEIIGMTDDELAQLIADGVLQ